jgi:hypothetical protein
MTIVEYQSGKMLWNVVGCSLLAILGIWVAFLPDWPVKIRIVGGLLGVTLPFAAIALALRMKSGLAALKFDRHTLAIATFFRSASYRWDEVRDISRETLTQSGTFGLFKQDLAHYLVLTVSAGDGTLETYRIQEDLLDWPKDGFGALAERMVALWMGQSALAGGPSPVLSKPASAPPTLNGVPMRAGAPSGFGRRGL